MTKEVIVKTQSDLDKIKLDFSGEITIKDTTEKINIKNAYPNAYIRVCGSARIGSVYGSARIGSVYGSARIGSVYCSARIDYVYDSARIDYVYDSASIGSVYGSASIDYVYGSASILLMTALATVTLIRSAKEIHLKGSAFVRYLKDAKKAIKIESKKAVAIEYIETETKDWEWYEDNYPVIVKRGKAILYKSVHKKDGKYFSDYDKSFPYEIGKTYKHECYPRERLSCSVGLHVAHKYWAMGFGAGWSDRALLECEVPVKDIVVCDDCDGKVRTPTLKVVKEVKWE